MPLSTNLNFALLQVMPTTMEQLKRSSFKKVVNCLCHDLNPIYNIKGICYRVPVYANDSGAPLAWKLEISWAGIFFLSCQRSFDVTGSNKEKLLWCPHNFLTKQKFTFAISLHFQFYLPLKSHRYLPYQYLFFLLLHFTNIIEKTKRWVQ